VRTLEVLYEAARLPESELTPRLRRLYGGGLGFRGSLVYANFVESLDGVVAFPDPAVSSGPTISGRSLEDRFVMGLLRAFADCVLIGAGTMRADRGHLWTPAHILPALAADYARLRRRLGKPADPPLVVLTASGDLDPAERAVRKGVLVLTTEAGASRLQGRLPAGSQAVALGTHEVDARRAITYLRRRGHRLVLCEGGPHVIGQLLRARRLDGLFLTLSPLLAGRDRERRPGLVEGLELLPEVALAGRLLSLRRADSHLFLRYTIPRRGGT